MKYSQPFWLFSSRKGLRQGELLPSYIQFLNEYIPVSAPKLTFFPEYATLSVRNEKINSRKDRLS